MTIEESPATRRRGFPASASLDNSPRFKRYGLEGDCFQVTAVVRGRKRLFSDERLARVLEDALRFVRLDRAYVLAYVIMPDHVHALLIPRTPHTISQIMQTIKGYSARRINQVLETHGTVWQQSFHDRVIRNEEQLAAAVAYIETNPVKAGLVERPTDYPFSSAHAETTTDIEAWLSQ
jgi:REP element-mobilizing transposase RayT